MMSLWDALRMNMMISYQELVRTFPKVPKTDDNGKIILINGKPVMVDDPDGYNPVILKRLPEVTIFD